MKIKSVSDHSRSINNPLDNWGWIFKFIQSASIFYNTDKNYVDYVASNSWEMEGLKLLPWTVHGHLYILRFSKDLRW